MPACHSVRQLRRMKGLCTAHACLHVRTPDAALGCPLRPGGHVHIAATCTSHVQLAAFCWPLGWQPVTLCMHTTLSTNLCGACREAGNLTPPPPSALCDGTPCRRCNGTMWYQGQRRDEAEEVALTAEDTHKDGAIA